MSELEKFKTTREATVTDDLKELRLKKVTNTYRTQREYSPEDKVWFTRKIPVSEDVNEFTFPIRLVDRADIARLRKQSSPLLIIKKEDHYYVANIEKDINLLGANLFGHHKCAYSDKVCERLSSSSDGCPKVLDGLYKRIEDYSFIEEGFQTINCAVDAFVVVKCQNFKKLTKKANS